MVYVTLCNSKHLALLLGNLSNKESKLQKITIEFSMLLKSSRFSNYYTLSFQVSGDTDTRISHKFFFFFVQTDMTHRRYNVSPCNKSFTKMKPRLITKISSRIASSTQQILAVYTSKSTTSASTHQCNHIASKNISRLVSVFETNLKYV